MTFRAYRVVLGVAALGALALPECGPGFQPVESADDSAAAGGLDGEGGAMANGGSSRGGAENTGGSGDTSGAAGAGDQGGTDASGGQGGADSGGRGGTATGGKGGSATGGKGGSATGGGAGAGSDGGMGNAAGAGNMAGAPNGGSANGGNANGGSGNVGTAGGGNVMCSTSTFWDVTAGGYVTATGVQVSACWQGYAFARSSGPATSITPTNFTACGSPCALCVSGSVGNAGGSAILGFYLSQQVENPTPMPWTPISSGVSVFFTNNAGSPMQLVLEGEGGQRWCYNLTGITHPVFVTWSTFNTECIGGTGAPYDFKPLMSLQIVVPSDNSGSTPFDFCLDRANVSN
jgi:hypothetical protein